MSPMEPATLVSTSVQRNTRLDRIAHTWLDRKLIWIRSRRAFPIRPNRACPFRRGSERCLRLEAENHDEGVLVHEHAQIAAHQDEVASTPAPASSPSVRAIPRIEPQLAPRAPPPTPETPPRTPNPGAIKEP